MNSFFLYTVVFLFTLFLCRISQIFFVIDGMLSIKKKVFLSAIIGLPLILVLSLRYGVGTDYFNYERIFLYSQDSDSFAGQPGYYALMRAVSHLGGTFQGVIFLSSLLSVFFSIYACVSRKSSHLWLNIWFVECLFFGVWSDVIRQSIAISFFFLAYIQLEKKANLMFVLLVLVASMFHVSAVLLLPLVFFSMESQKDSFVSWKVAGSILFIGIVCILYLYFGNSANLMYSGYIDANHEGGRSFLFILLAVFLYIPELFFFKTMLLKSPRNYLLYIFLIFECVMYCFTIRVSYAFRLGYFFSIAHVFLYPQMIDSCESRESSCLLTLYSILCVFGAFCVQTFMFGFNGISVYSHIPFLIE